jgi:hypothetical protein
MISLANLTNSGVANSSSMIVPCMVNSSLCTWSDTMWLFRAHQLRPDDHRHDAADQEEPERRDQVQVTDDLVVSRGQPVRQQRPLAVAGRRSDLDWPGLPGHLAPPTACALAACLRGIPRAPSRMAVPAPGQAAETRSRGPGWTGRAAKTDSQQAPPRRLLNGHDANTPCPSIPARPGPWPMFQVASWNHQAAAGGLRGLEMSHCESGPGPSH